MLVSAKTRLTHWGNAVKNSFASAVFVIAGFCCAAVAALASETITYRYDARGRLIKVERSGSVNNNVVTNYSYDKADNRTNKTTTGAPK
jgi:hypothetical protein